MEKEVFEDKEAAALLNEIFVSIKVDREERPDIDKLYMTVSQMLIRSGGWPINIIMTPDKTAVSQDKTALSCIAIETDNREFRAF